MVFHYLNIGVQTKVHVTFEDITKIKKIVVQVLSRDKNFDLLKVDILVAFYF